MPAAMFWMRRSGEVLRDFGTSNKGLSSREAQNRLKKFGPNTIEIGGGMPAIRLLANQFTNPLILILVGAAVLAAFLGEVRDAIIIIAIVLVNGLLGFAQEYRSEKALQKLRKFVTFSAKVLRDGVKAEIDVGQLVPGDVVMVELGDRVPADLRLTSVDALSIDESVLTGESFPVKKHINPLVKENPLPHEMDNTAFMGSTVANGSGIGVVVATGSQTYFGRTAVLLREIKAEGEFQRNVRKFGNLLLKIIVAITIFVFIVNAAMGKPVLSSLLFAVALAVGMIPEALPFVITLSLSRSSMKLAHKGVVVKRLSAIEDLGNVDVICTDKTGTLTENKITLRDYFDADKKQNKKLLLHSLLCNSAVLGKKHIAGNPIDVSVWDYAEAHFDLRKIREYRHIELLPFDYERRLMSAVVEKGGKRLFISKGSPEAVIRICDKIEKGEKQAAMTDAMRKRLIKEFHEISAEGYRAIAVAEKTIGNKHYSHADEHGLTFLGFVTFFDPPKKGVKETLELAQKLNVKIKILTGDNPTVSKFVLNQVGFSISDSDILTGDRIAEMDEAELRQAVEKINVFSRVTPEQKHLILKALHANGHVTAYLGDGVNDAPALKEADAGIAVNSGADIAKEAADVVLLHKNLHSVIEGIESGRKTFANINKYILYTFASNTGNMGSIAIVSGFISFIPLLPAQVLLLNLLSDAPQLAVSTDTVEDEELLKPRHWDIRALAKFGIGFGLISSVFDILVISVLFHQPQAVFQTGLFLESVMTELIIIFSLRTRKPIFLAKAPSWIFVAASAIAAAVAFALLLTPAGALFDFAVLPVYLIVAIMAIVFAYFAATEVAKAVLNHFYRPVAATKKEIALIRREKFE